MNFDDAIKAHMDWKLRLRACIDKTSKEKLDASIIAQDNQCVLGKWIHGEGAKFASDPAYEPLKKTHAAFHQCAASIVKHCEAGTATDALVDNGSEFVKLSTEVVGKIVAIRKRAQQKAA